jgi:hypothetical protein
MKLAAFCAVLLFATTVAAQTSQPRLEVGTRQGNYYWIVETSSDGSRRGGWVPVNVPIDAIDRAALKPLPPVAALSPADRPSSVPAAPTSIDDRLARIEAALANSGGQPIAQDAVQSTPLPRTRIDPSSPAPSLGHPQTRQGFWFNAGLGAGWAGCVDCLGREVGSSGGLSLGATLTDRVLFGVGTSGWYKSVDGVSLTGGTFDARLRFYPVTKSGFFLTGGAGLGSIAVKVGTLSERENGLGLLFGLGWDVRVGRNVSVTPFYNGFAVGVDSGTFFVDQIGVGITIH